MIPSICKEGVSMSLLLQTLSNNAPARYIKYRTVFIRYTVILLLFLLLPCSSRMESDDSEIPCDNDIVTVETADNSGSRLTAEEVVLEGKTSGIKRLHVFTAAEGRILVQASGKTGYRYVWTGDGARTDAWKITGETGSLCALMRIGTTHHAAVRVTARKTSWATDRPDEEFYLWINAYSSTNPAVIPASTARRAIAHGEMLIDS